MSNTGFNHKHLLCKQDPNLKTSITSQLLKLYTEFLQSGQNNKTCVKALKNRRTWTKYMKGNPDAVEVKLIRQSLKIHIVGNSNSKINDK